jgi:hypothetical protein
MYTDQLALQILTIMKTLWLKDGLDLAVQVPFVSNRMCY